MAPRHRRVVLELKDGWCPYQWYFARYLRLDRWRNTLRWWRQGAFAQRWRSWQEMYVYSWFGYITFKYAYFCFCISYGSYWELGRQAVLRRSQQGLWKLDICHWWYFIRFAFAPLGQPWCWREQHWWRHLPSWRKNIGHQSRWLTESFHYRRWVHVNLLHSLWSWSRYGGLCARETRQWRNIAHLWGRLWGIFWTWYYFLRK